MAQQDVSCKTTGEIASILRGNLGEFPDFAAHLAYCPQCYAHALHNARHFDRMGQLDLLLIMFPWSDKATHPTIHHIQQWEGEAVQRHVRGCTFCLHTQANLRAAMSGRAQGA